jgi:RNA-directed DNA polymerase
MHTWPPHLYLEQGAARGLPVETLQNSLTQATQAQSRGVPAILTLRHLAQHTGVPYTFLRECVQRSVSEPYRFFRVAKRSGGYRLICIPHPLLHQAQSWLARHVLGIQVPHHAAFAYVRKKGVVDCAQLHCGSRWLIKLDVQQFFESISERQVYHAIRSIGYQPLIAFELSRVCTRTANHAPLRYRRRRWSNSHAARTHRAIPSYLKWHVGHLPQGAPTSPPLSNLALHNLDDQLCGLAAARGTVFTRYADDLVFSTSSKSFTRNNAMELVSSVFQAMLKFGLRPHTAKTHIAPPGARKVVLGLLVDSDRPRLRRQFRQKLEVHVHYLEKLGPTEHAMQRGFRSIFAMQQYIRGLLSYARQVEPTFADALFQRLDKIEWPI